MENIWGGERKLAGKGLLAKFGDLGIKSVLY